MESQRVSTPDPADDSYRSLTNAIRNRLPWDELKPKLQGLSQSCLEREDEDHLNFLHHAIKADYPEIVHYLFLRGYFMELQQPSLIPYLHLACFYGCTVIVGILLKERPSDFQRGLSVKPILNVGESETCSLKHIPLSELKQYTPLDLAAAAKHIRCVQLLLNINQSFPSMLESAVERGSTESVRLLLKEDESISQSDVNRAFKLALTRKLPRCLELLLNHGVEVNQVLNTMNAYHVMYMYSSGYQMHRERNEGLAECTAVLIKNGEDVNTDYPSGTYPLYSLIHAMFEELECGQIAPPVHHMRALEYLLKAGADPNLDEESLIDSKYNQSDFFFSFSLGRDPYTSALSALIVLMEQFNTLDGCSMKTFTECMETILIHGGNPQSMNRYGDMPLHDLMKCLAMQHSDYYLRLDLSALIKLLLRYGADANEPSSNGILPINYYFTLMLCLPNRSLKPEELFTDWCQFAVPRQVFNLFQYMDHDKMYDSYRIILNQFYAMTDECYLKTVTEYVKSEMDVFVHQPRTLLFMCSADIWKQVDRRQSNIEKLPLPKSLKTVILDMFN